MIEVRFRPMVSWPHPETAAYERRSRWTFKVPLSRTLELLDRELHMLRARSVMLGVGLRESDIRNDGWPRSDARAPAHPGVELSFDHTKHGRLVYATDACQWWEHNVRSIALGLEALRAVDRFGISRRGEQYAGWRALGSGIVAGSGPVTVDSAWEILYAAVGADAEDEEWELAELYHRAAKATHPDTGGDAESFVQVQAAYEFLKASA